MLIWSSALDLLRVLLFALAHVCGGSLGAGIVVVSLLVRIALLPYTLRLAIRARAHQAAVRRLAPKVEKLRKRYATDPIRLARETQALHAANGIPFVPKGTWVGGVVQATIGGAVYRVVATSARRALGFLWIGDLTRPDALVASIAAGLAGAAVMTSGATAGSSPRTAAVLSAGITFLLAWRLSASLGLYWVASNMVGVVQSLLLWRSAGADAGT